MRGLGTYLPLGSENEANEKPNLATRQKGTMLKRGLKKYVRTRTRGIRFCKRGIPTPYHDNRGADYNDMDEPISRYAYHPETTSFRYPIQTLTFVDLPTLILEIPDFDFEPWLLELWNDFLVEPTPYLVVSAMLYLGFLLLVSHYYDAIWRIICLWFYFLPWDDEWILGYR